MSTPSHPGSVPRGVAVLVAGVALLAPPSLAAAAEPGSGPLSGQWVSTDGDGSHQTLEITGSGTRAYSMVYVDDSATGACGGNPARLSGPGYVEGDDVVMVAVLVCLPGGSHLRERLAIGFHHDTASDTLTASFDIVWHRVG